MKIRALYRYITNGWLIWPVCCAIYLYWTFITYDIQHVDDARVPQGSSTTEHDGDYSYDAMIENNLYRYRHHHYVHRMQWTRIFATVSFLMRLALWVNDVYSERELTDASPYSLTSRYIHETSLSWVVPWIPIKWTYDGLGLLVNLSQICPKWLVIAMQCLVWYIGWFEYEYDRIVAASCSQSSFAVKATLSPSSTSSLSNSNTTIRAQVIQNLMIVWNTLSRIFQMQQETLLVYLYSSHFGINRLQTQEEHAQFEAEHRNVTPFSYYMSIWIPHLLQTSLWYWMATERATVYILRSDDNIISQRSVKRRSENINTDRGSTDNTDHHFMDPIPGLWIPYYLWCVFSAYTFSFSEFVLPWTLYLTLLWAVASTYPVRVA